MIVFQSVSPFLLLLSILHSTALQPDWTDYIAKDLLEKHGGKRFIGYTTGLFQGDITGIDHSLTPEDLKGKLNSALTDSSKTWPNGIIPYELSPKYHLEESRLEKAMIQVAMDLTASSTSDCVRFVPRTNEADYVYIARGLSCSSNVGRTGGKQQLSYTRGCLEEVGTIQHGLLHVLGFYHEHTRVDRDGFVTINWDNLPLTAAKDMRIPTDEVNFGLKYDYDSIMHFRFNALAKNSFLPTIVPKEKGRRIGQNANMSVMDVLKLKKAYGCAMEEHERAVFRMMPRKQKQRERGVVHTTTASVASIENTRKDKLIGANVRECKSVDADDCYVLPESR